MECLTIKIKPSSPEQGEFVVINESDFDPAKHERHTDSPATPLEASAPMPDVLTDIPTKRHRKQS